MHDAAANLEFEEAARVRDDIRGLETNELEPLGQAALAMADINPARMQNSGVLRRAHRLGRPRQAGPA
ncbi:UvrB/UvrC motif-containing protein [Reyranella sp.]|uniref:UvrB/UvrC motif-containing protein n=1 Tax=Reyranella sp. TaxID=1929291 RepID=UPI0034274453